MYSTTGQKPTTREKKMNTFTITVDTPQEEILNAESFTKGDLIKIKVPLYNHAERFIDKIGIVSFIYPGNMYVEVPEDNPESHNYPTTSIRVTSGVKLKEEDIVDTVSVVQFLKLTKMYRQILADADKAMLVISGRLITESQDRDWCDEFDNIIEEVNEELPSRFQLEARERDYNVTWTETYIVTVQRNEIVRTTCAETAVEMATDLESNVDSTELLDAVRYNNYEFNDADDYEAELT